jgi:hypothetical protein
MSSAVWVKLCGACGRSMEGATGCLGTVENRHAPSGYVMVKMVPEAELARERERGDRLEAGLLVRQEERDESEAARARLEEAVEALLREFDAEEDEHGFPFNLALRRAHRELVAALSASRGGKP